MSLCRRRLAIVVLLPQMAIGPILKGFDILRCHHCLVAKERQATRAQSVSENSMPLPSVLLGSTRELLRGSPTPACRLHSPIGNLTAVGLPNAVIA